jgi:hypothetical protein
MCDTLRSLNGGDGGVVDFCFDDGMCVPISRRDQIQGELARLGVVEFLVPMTPGGLATEVVATVAGMPILRMGGRLVVRVLDSFRPATMDELTGAGARVRGTDALEGGGATNRITMPDRRAEIGELFDNGHPRSGIQIGDKTVLADPTNRGGARIFDGVSDSEVRDYFTQLTGQPFPSNPTTVVPGRGNILNRAGFAGG